MLCSASAPASPLDRRGVTTPVVAGVLLVTMLGMALILDRLWLEAARLELNTAAEASALAAARELASDGLLLPDFDPADFEDQAVQAALMTAAQNYAAGQAVDINEADITFTPQPDENSSAATVWTAEQKTPPDRVVVTAHRTRFRGNPVALFISELTGQPWGDAVGRAAARVDGHVAGVRPVAGAYVPAIPLAIWERDPAGERIDTWHAAIELRGGSDQYGIDPGTQQVTEAPDGIPELTLKTQARRGTNSVANVQLIDLGSNFEDERIRRQFVRGWSAADLAAWGGELRVPGTAAQTGTEQLSVPGMPTLAERDQDDLESLLGAPRIALLYSTATPTRDPRVYDVACVRLVALRVLSVSPQADGSCQVVVQPTVLATRSAVCEAKADDTAPQDPTEPAATVQDADQNPSQNPNQHPQRQTSYIYRLELTR